MNFLENILSLILGEKSKDLMPLLDALFKNGFNLKALLNTVDLQTVATAVTPFLGAFKESKTDTSPQKTPYDFNLKEIAGNDVFDLLNAHFDGVW